MHLARFGRLIALVVGLVVVTAGGVFLWKSQRTTHEAKITLHLYNWAHYVPEVLLKKFEAETGIVVVYNCFDSVETLETQMLLDAPYDVVFVPMWPMLERCIQAKRLRPLNKSLLPHAKGVDTHFVQKAGWPLDYAMPYLWGTTGIGCDVKRVKAAAPGAPLDSWGLLFDPKWAAQLAQEGIELNDSVTDVLQSILLYLGLPPNTQDIAVWDKAVNHMMRLRSYIADFDSHQHLEKLISGQAAVLQGFSSYVQMAVAENTDPSKDLRYVIPKEGAVMWIDLMVIPRQSPHPKQAHQFIDFMMRPENIAVATQVQKCPNVIPASREFLELDSHGQPLFTISDKDMARLHADFVPSPALTRHLCRQWCKIKMNYNPKDPVWSFWGFWPFSKTCLKEKLPS